MSSRPNPHRDPESEAWDRVALPSDLKQTLIQAWREMAQAARADGAPASSGPINVLLCGPPGSGKTEISRRAFAAIPGVRFMAVGNSDLRAQYIGQAASRVRTLFDRAREIAPVVLRVDDLQYLCPAPTDPHADPFGAELVPELLMELDAVREARAPIFLVAETFEAAKVHPALVSRFSLVVDLPLPGEAQRRQILRQEIEEAPADPALDVEEISALVARATSGKSGRDLDTLVHRAKERCARDERAPVGELRGMREALLAELPPGLSSDTLSSTAATPAAAPGAVTTVACELTGRENLVLPEELSSKLSGLTEMLRAGDILTPVLLFGPPGCGKTLIARVLASESGRPLIAVSPADIRPTLVGGAGPKLAEFFAMARAKSPSIFDDIEWLVPRDEREPAGEIIVQLLTEIKLNEDLNRDVLLLAAATQRDRIDPMFCCHLSHQIEVPLPGSQERCRILESLLARVPRDFDAASVAAQIAAALENASPRDLRNLVDRATHKALARALQAGSPDKVVLRQEDLFLSIAPGPK